MDKLLKKNGLDDTRHELKYSTSSSKKISMGQYPDQSLMSTKRNFRESRICQCKEQSPQNDRSQILWKIQENQRPGFIRKQKPFKNIHESKSGPKLSSNIQSASKPTELKPINMISPPMYQKNSFSSKRQQTQTQPLQKGQQLQQNIQQKQNSKIEEIISFLRQKLLMKCSLQRHERNRILYVCLEPNCPSRIGCSYCFLHSHQNHLKCQISTCIKDLQELSFKVNANEQLFSNKVQNLYCEFSEKLDAQIQNIRTEFETNLSFVKMKVKNEFESYYKEKYLTYLQKESRKVSQFHIDTNFQDYQITPQKAQNSCYKQGKKPNLNDLIKQKELLTNLTGLKIDQVYSYLIKRSEILHLEAAESKILLQFFEEMNSSLTKLFSAFKRNLPKIFAERSFLQKPLIISFS